MGATSVLHVFDYDCYLNCVAPAFRDLLANGRAGPWLEQVWRRSFRRSETYQADPFIPPTPRAPSEDDVYLNGDLSRAQVVTACRVPGGRVRGLQCDAGLENLWRLFEATLKQYCLGPLQFMGRKRSPFSYLDGLPEAPWGRGVNAPLRLRTLLTDLDERGRFWCHGSGGWSEGVHGWLSPPETAELAVQLAALPLPNYEPSWQAVRAIGPRHDDNYPDASIHALRLSQVRTVAVLASREGRGVLWGNDVYFHGVEPNRPPSLLPGWKTWRGGLIVRMAQAIQKDGRFSALPVLADAAIEESGFAEPTILGPLPGTRERRLGLLGRATATARSKRSGLGKTVTGRCGLISEQMNPRRSHERRGFSFPVSGQPALRPPPSAEPESTARPR